MRGERAAIVSGEFLHYDRWLLAALAHLALTLCGMTPTIPSSLL